MITLEKIYLVTLTLRRSTNTVRYSLWWGSLCVFVWVCVCPRMHICTFSDTEVNQSTRCWGNNFFTGFDLPVSKLASMLSKSSSLRSKQTTTKELIPRYHSQRKHISHTTSTLHSRAPLTNPPFFLNEIQCGSHSVLFPANQGAQTVKFKMLWRSVCLSWICVSDTLNTQV